MNNKPTFNQIITGIFSLLCLAALILMYFFKSHVSDTITGGIVVAFVAAFKDFATSFIKSDLDSKQAESNSQLVDALKNSSPISK